MIDIPRPSVADVQRLVAAQLSVPSRVGHVLLLVVSVIVATAGRTGISRVMLGSVAEAVVRAAPCSVLVVRLKGGG